jgi:hypothetical protein
VEMVIGDKENCLRKKKGTIDEIHILLTIIGKAYVHKIDILFIVFKETFDSIHRHKLIKNLQQIIPTKSISSVRTTLVACEAKAVIENNITEIFNINLSVRKGDALSVTLFCIVLGYNEKI